MKRETEEWREVKANTPSPGHVQFGAMAPGRGLDCMNRVMLKGLEGVVEKWVKEGRSEGEGKGGRRTGLYEWVKEMVVEPTTEGVFGEGNPYRRREIREAYW